MPSFRPARAGLALLALALVPLPVTAQLVQGPAVETAGVDEDPYRLVLVEGPLTRLLPLQSALNLDIANVRADGTIEVLARDRDLVALQAYGLPHTVAIADLRSYYRERLTAIDADDGLAQAAFGSSLSPAFGAGSMGGYYTFTEVEAVLDQLTALAPSALGAKQSLGQTVQGRTQWWLRISDNPGVDEGEPEVRFDALHHAREPEGMQTLLWFMLWIAENYGTDPLATYLVDEREIYCVPVVNPDGYVHNQSTDPNGGGLWRKNRRDNGDGTFGVDLNRNYPEFWGYDNVGSSGSTSNDLYRGPSPASEPETQNMLAFMAAHEFRTALSIHCFGNVWLAPYGYDFVPVENPAEYDEVGALVTGDNGYEFGPGPEVLYAANGVTFDTDHLGGAMAWTPEIGGDNDGFWPDTDRIVPLAEDNLAALQRTALAAGAWARLASTTLIDEGDGDGDVDAGETVAVVLGVRNSGRADTATAVTATLSSTSPVATILDASHDFGTLASFTSTDNAGAPLRLAVDAATPGGTVIAYTLTLTYEGWTQSLPGHLIVGSARPLVFDDVELDLGWTAGVPGDTASTGLWERGDPVGTDSNGEPANPENDNSVPGTQAFVTGNAGGSAGNDDVDDGETTLLTPLIDLSGTGPALIRYARWFADLSTADDTFDVSISNDGGDNWTALESVTGNANAWTDAEFLVEEFLPQTESMQLRFVARDDPNNSVVEAAIDDLVVSIFDVSPRIVLYGSTGIGASLSFNVSGEAGDLYSWYLSPGTANLSLGGIDGPLLLDPSALIGLFGGTVPASGLSGIVLGIPADPGLVGLTAYVQALVVRDGDKFLTNRDTLTVE